jgi:hypothetical protein
LRRIRISSNSRVSNTAASTTSIELSQPRVARAAGDPVTFGEVIARSLTTAAMPIAITLDRQRVGIM